MITSTHSSPAPLTTLDKYYSLITNFLIFVLLAGSIALDNALGGAAILLFLLALSNLVFRFKKLSPPSQIEKVWIYLLIATFISSLISFYIKEPETRELSDLDIPFRYLTVIPLIFLLKSVTINFGVIWWGVNIATISGSLFAAYQFHWLELPKAFGALNHHIVFGDIALALGFLCLASIRYFSDKGVLKVLPYVGLVCGLVCSVYSQARGGWVALPLLYLLVVFFHWKNFNIISKLFTVLLIPSIITAIFLIPSNPVLKRVEATMYDFNKYLTDPERGHIGPLGSRFEMFKGALIIFESSPVVGAGLNTFVSEYDKLEESQTLRPIANIYTHPHNEYLHTLAARGLLGLFVLVLFIALPFKYFWSKYQYEKSNKMAYGAVFFILAYVQFALSEAMFDRMSSLMLYLYLLTILMCSSVQSREQEKS